MWCTMYYILNSNGNLNQHKLRFDTTKVNSAFEGGKVEVTVPHSPSEEMERIMNVRSEGGEQDEKEQK